MENKLTKLIAVLAVLGLMATGPLAYAGSEGEGQTSGKSWGHGKGQSPDFFKELNLTAEQKEKLKAQREGKKDERKALREQMKTKMQALHEAISKPATKRADVNGLVGEVNAIKGQMFAQKIDGIFAMKEVLTPEQFAKMQAQHKARMDKMQDGKGRHQGGSEGEEPEMEKN